MERERVGGQIIWACQRCDKVILYVRGELPNKIPLGPCPKRTKGVQGGGADRWTKK